jgi:DNA-binding MarR family transcriptional regulator
VWHRVAMTAAERRRNLVGAFALAIADRIQTEAEAVTGLSGEAPAALSVIAQQPGGTVEELRRAINRSQPATVRIVDRLVQRGLVVRRPAGRGPALALDATDAGRDIARRVLQARARILDELQPADLQALELQLAPILERLAELPLGQTVCRLCDKNACRRTGDCPVTNRLESQGLHLDPPQPLAQ